MAIDRRYNVIGALNNIIMVYPTSKTSMDTWLIKDTEDNKESPLVQGILKMIERLTLDECRAALDLAE